MDRLSKPSQHPKPLDKDRTSSRSTYSLPSFSPSC